MRRALFIYALLLVYVSLYPFDFSSARWPKEPPISLADMLANLLAFIPVGLFLRGIFIQRHEARLNVSLGIAIMAAVLFAAILQWLQIFLPTRTAALMDVAMNTVGIGIGLFLAFWAYHHGVQQGLRQWFNQPSAWLLVFWSLYLLSPFIPLGPMTALKQWQKLAAQTFSLYVFMQQFFAWFVIVALLRVPNKWLIIYAMLLLSGGVFIRHSGIHVEHFFGAVTALLLGEFFSQESRSKLMVVLLFVAVWLFVRGLFPFQMSEVIHEFEWLPFKSLMQTDPRVALSVLMEKCFWYGALLLVLRLYFIEKWHAFGAGMLVLCVIELLQLFYVEHYPESTDLILYALLFAGYHAMCKTASGDAHKNDSTNQRRSNG